MRFYSVVLLGLALVLPAHAEEEKTPVVQLEGLAPYYEFPGLSKKIDTVWEIVSQMFLPEKMRSSVEPPHIAFFPFEKDRQSATWTLFQREWILSHPEIWKDWFSFKNVKNPPEITPEWAKENIEKIFPFPKTFLALHYDRTRFIQINPERTFLSFYTNQPDGTKADTTGFGYYTVAHEMLHYALEARGVTETRLHHCLFVADGTQEEAPMGRLARALATFGISHEIVYWRGFFGERAFNPCNELSPEELERANEWKQILSK